MPASPAVGVLGDVSALGITGSPPSLLMVFVWGRELCDLVSGMVKVAKPSICTAILFIPRSKFNDRKYMPWVLNPSRFGGVPPDMGKGFFDLYQLSTLLQASNMKSFASTGAPVAVVGLLAVSLVYPSPRAIT